MNRSQAKYIAIADYLVHEGCQPARTHQGEASLLQVFEGFKDFLTYLIRKKTDTPEGAVLVLNFTNRWRRALPYLQDQRFSDIQLYIDNDVAGKAATDGLTLESGQSCTKDMRSHYKDAEDLNDLSRGP